MFFRQRNTNELLRLDSKISVLYCLLVILLLTANTPFRGQTPVDISASRETVQQSKKKEAERSPLDCARYLAALIPQSEGGDILQAHLSVCFARAGRSEEAREIVMTLEHPDIKIHTFSEIAAALMERGQEKEALSVLTEAAKITKWLGTNPFELKEQTDLARRFNEIGETEQARHQLSMALESARKPATPFSQVELLVEIANTYTEIGQKSFSATILTDSFELAKMIDNILFKASVMTKIAVGYFLCGRNSLALLTLSQALRSAQSSINKVSLAESLAAVAPGYAAIGYQERAEELLNRAGTVAGTEPVDFARGKAVLDISEAYLQINRPDLALTNVKSISYFSLEDSKHLLTQKIAEHYAQNGDCDRALEIIETGRVFSRDTVLFKVATVYAARGRFDRAFTMTEAIRDTYYKTRTLTAIGRRFGETGQQEKAGKFIEEALQLLTTVKKTEPGYLFRITALIEIGLAYEDFNLPINVQVKRFLHTLLETVDIPFMKKYPPLSPPDEVTIKMIIGSKSFKQVGLEYRNHYYTLGINEEVEGHFKILDILEFSVKVLDYRTNHEILFTIEPF